MAMTGLWETWKPADGEPVQSCTVCTTDANPFMLDFHDRMPVILPDAMIEPWLDLSIKDPAALKPIVAQFPTDELQEWPVSKDAGNVRNQRSHLAEPLK